MTTGRPVIGVTGSSGRGRWLHRVTCWALMRRGADVVRLSTVRPVSPRRLDGLVIGGGTDVHPARYDGEVALITRVDPARDALELGLLDLAAEHGLPVLGICRGAQLLAVHAGGRLVQDLGTRFPGRRERLLLPRRRVELRPGSRLARILGRTRLRVNGLHRQAVERPGRGQVACAFDGDGVIQALESERGPLRLGVQWHPELMPPGASRSRLIGGFLAAARATRGLATPGARSA